MKRILLITLTIVLTGICGMATPPNLAVEKIFERKELRTEGHKFMMSKSKDNYFRSVKADNDKELLEEVKKAIEQDKKKAFNLVESFNGSKNNVILNIQNNEYTINVGFNWTEDGSVNLFIQSNPEAFE